VTNDQTLEKKKGEASKNRGEEADVITYDRKISGTDKIRRADPLEREGH